MKFPLLDNLNTIIKLLTTSMLVVGLSLAGLIGVIAICKILLDSHNRSGIARSERWETLTLVFICIGLLAALFSIIAFVHNIGGAV